jgi:site-specific recombinase XerD
MRGTVHGTALTLLYLTGLRLGEVLHLAIGDVDLTGQLLHVRRTKFGKSRIVPMASDMTERMRACSEVIRRRLGARDSKAQFFVGPTGKPLSRTALRTSFREMLSQAGIAQQGVVKRPRLHDLRGTFAVHRLLLWYEQDADLDAKLPLLSTYLGHVGLASSQRYLQLTKEFAGEVTRRQHARFGHLIKEGT